MGRRATERLFPSRFSDRYYHLTTLRRQIEEVAAEWLSATRKSVVVDVGCGTMPYRPIFEPYAAEYLGVDLPSNPRADVHIGQDGRITLPDAVADLVLSTQVLEHVESPANYLRECSRVLKTNGLLILSTHGYWMYHLDPIDLWRWTSHGLKRTLEQAGFKVARIHGLMGLAPTGLQLLQDGLMPKLPGVIRPVFALTAQVGIALLDRLHGKRERDRDACTYVVIANKRLANE